MPVELRHRQLRAVVAPETGGALVSLGDDLGAILRSGPDPLHSPLDAAHFPCVPFFGRIAALHGRALKTTMGEPGDPALHGDGWLAPWRIIAQSAARIEIAFSAAGDGPSAFPHAYEARETFTLDDDGLCVSLSVRNLEPQPAPFGVGLHPYFPRTEDTGVAFAAKRLWRPPHCGGAGAFDGLPDAIGAGAAAPLPAATRDDSYDGFAGAAKISSAKGAISLRAETPYLHLYAPAGADFFCLEPVSHLPGRIMSEPMLAPGETRAIAMRVARINERFHERG
jgi:aldose 1-epimerase